MIVKQLQIAFRAVNQQMTLLPRKIQIGIRGNARLIWGHMFCELNILMFISYDVEQEQKYAWVCTGFPSSDGSFMTATFTLQKTSRIPTVFWFKSFVHLSHDSCIGSVYRKQKLVNISNFIWLFTVTQFFKSVWWVGKWTFTKQDTKLTVY